jgi:hypothetical protein
MTGFTSNINTGNLNATGLVSAAGNVSAGNLIVTGNIVDTGALTIITGSNGNITLAPNGTGNVNITANVSVTGNITGNYVLGNGSQLTGLAAANSSIAITTTTISANVTIGNGTNGFSVGPMTTANNVQVVLTPGQRWIII